MSKHQPDNTDVKQIETSVKGVAEKIPTNPQLQKFQTADGPFGWFAHGVTGAELNHFVNDIQKHLIESHENNIELRDKYDQLIWDLGELDKKYVQDNVTAVKASEKACQEARDVKKEIDSVIQANTDLKKRLKVAYWIAGCSAFIALAALVLRFIP